MTFILASAFDTVIAVEPTKVHANLMICHYATGFHWLLRRGSDVSLQDSNVAAGHLARLLS